MRKTIPQIEAKILALRKKLKGKKISENFGSEEQTQLEDFIGNIYDYPFTERQHILDYKQAFFDWCSTYNGGINNE